MIGGPNLIYYKVTAVYTPVEGGRQSESSPTNTVVTDGGLYKNVVSNSLIKLNYNLAQNFPNPFNPSTKITYAIPEGAIVQIKIYDILGTEVADLVNETKPAGYYEITFNTSELSSGVYIYRITALSGDRILFSQSKQMILIK